METNALLSNINVFRLGVLEKELAPTSVNWFCDNRNFFSRSSSGKSGKFWNVLSVKSTYSIPGSDWTNWTGTDSRWLCERLTLKNVTFRLSLTSGSSGIVKSLSAQMSVFLCWSLGTELLSSRQEHGEGNGHWTCASHCIIFCRAMNITIAQQIAFLTACIFQTIWKETNM